jgi:hypothetical protein
MKSILPLLCLMASLLVSLGADLEREFAVPPAAAKPWVYWFWMDGNVSREGITADLEAMHRAGIGGLLLMEVDVGVPRGPVKFMSKPWRELFTHAVREAERLGLEITLNAGPGWTGSGGPWVRPEQSMQHLVATETPVTGPTNLSQVLPQPAPRPPYFGEAGLAPEMIQARKNFYADVAVLALPLPGAPDRLSDLEEKALYLRHPYSSKPGVKPHLPAPAVHPEFPPRAVVPSSQILDLTTHLDANGRLTWAVPPGQWLVLRFGRTSTGANTRPAPAPGLGLECDKFDSAALAAHFENFLGTLLKDLGPLDPRRTTGWTTLHIDSWEMGSQNWTGRFREEFQRRRGYDPLRYLPAYQGLVVDSLATTERFLWDVRQTAQELVVTNHALRLRELGRPYGFKLSIEPYDMNPCADLSLGGAADVPMCEFWSQGYGFNSAFSCLESVSIGHTLGRPIIAAEAFTASAAEAWRLYPGAMKAQGDWAFCAGINRLVFHRYAHQPWLDRWPGMTMGPYGVHYERTQTWWPMVGAYHTYLQRCQHLLRQGQPVADILYLAAEGAPHVFRPPPSAISGEAALPDRRGHNFDGCAPETLLQRITVHAGRLTTPEGMSYRLLVLPENDTMTPPLLRKIRDLVRAGATVLGPCPRKSPSLTGYPGCDDEVAQLAAELWGPEGTHPPGGERKLGRGRLILSHPPRNPSALKQAARLDRQSQWIWHPEGSPTASAPVGVRWFRRPWVIAPGTIAEAWLAMTADNSFEVRVNGQRAGQGDNFTQLFALDISACLKPGTNLLEVVATNGGDAPNPAGLIGTLTVRYADGRQLTLNTDAQWESAATDHGPWQPALVLGSLGLKPWGKTPAAPEQTTFPDSYGDYAQAAGILARAGVRPDFEADLPLRYTHRQVGKTDLYFVANPVDQAVRGRAWFRVAGRQPELWDPVTGQTRLLPEFTQAEGRTSLPLELAPHQSCFIVFRTPASGRRKTGATNAQPLKPLAQLAGSWEVSFAERWGGPAKLVFAELQDWTARPEAGVRHYSGLATYRKQFNLPAGHPAARPLFLDLGSVHNLARVRLNGRDLGVIWCAPWRVDITAAAKPTGNELEIEVANLWPNRLIGDAGQPAEQRLTWTTFQPYKKDAALLPSGLLGPVTLQTP